MLVGVTYVALSLESRRITVLHHTSCLYSIHPRPQATSSSDASAVPRHKRRTSEDLEGKPSSDAIADEWSLNEISALPEGGKWGSRLDSVRLDTGPSRRWRMSVFLRFRESDDIDCSARAWCYGRLSDSALSFCPYPPHHAVIYSYPPSHRKESAICPTSKVTCQTRL
jgi:hypothetical protein